MARTFFIGKFAGEHHYGDTKNKDMTFADFTKNVITRDGIIEPRLGMYQLTRTLRGLTNSEPIMNVFGFNSSFSNSQSIIGVSRGNVFVIPDHANGE